MEKTIYKTMEKTMELPNVNGVLLADADGLCIAAQGTAKQSSAGLISSLAKQALATQPSDSTWLYPVITVETDNNKKIVIRSTVKATTALYKTSPSPSS